MVVTAKVTARGLHDSVPTTIVCIEEDGDDLENGKITFLIPVAQGVATMTSRVLFFKGAD